MSASEAKSDVIYVRVTPQTKRQLNEVASQYGMLPSDVVRELVTALIEGRVTVSPPANVKEFYNVPRIQD